MDNNRKEKKFFEYSVENRMGQSVETKKRSTFCGVNRSLYFIFSSGYGNRTRMSCVRGMYPNR